MQQYDLKWVREAVGHVKADDSGNIRVHPNGFIQLDLLPTEQTWHASHHKGHSGANLRLHIWDPPGFKLPRQETVNEIHTHVFDMRSTVVIGRLTQRCYAFVVGKEYRDTKEHPQFMLYKAVYGAESASSRLENTGIIGTVEEHLTYPVYPGMTYNQPAFTFHDTEVARSPLVTVMQKAEVHVGDAYVCVPVDIEPDNDFDRATAAPEEYLWAAVKAAIL